MPRVTPLGCSATATKSCSSSWPTTPRSPSATLSSYARTVSLSRGLVEAQEVERRSIAHELHDQIGQDLTAIKLLLRRAARADGDARRVPEADALSLVDELIDRVRGLSLDLRPPMLDDLGLVPTLSNTRRPRSRGWSAR